MIPRIGSPYLTHRQERTLTPDPPGPPGRFARLATGGLAGHRRAEVRTHEGERRRCHRTTAPPDRGPASSSARWWPPSRSPRPACASSDDPAPGTGLGAPAPTGSGTATGTAIPGTAPPTVVRRPAGTAPPGTFAPTSGTAPSGTAPRGTAPPGTNVDLPNRSIEPDEVALDVTWTANATDHQGDDGLFVAYDCTPDGIDATVWGDGVYTDDSSVCTAAVFEGLITVGGRRTGRDPDHRRARPLPSPRPPTASRRSPTPRGPAASGSPAPDRRYHQPPSHRPEHRRSERSSHGRRADDVDSPPLRRSPLAAVPRPTPPPDRRRHALAVVAGAAACGSDSGTSTVAERDGVEREPRHHLGHDAGNHAEGHHPEGHDAEHDRRDDAQGHRGPDVAAHRRRRRRQQRDRGGARGRRRHVGAQPVRVPRPARRALRVRLPARRHREHRLGQRPLHRRLLGLHRGRARRVHHVRGRRPGRDRDARRRRSLPGQHQATASPASTTPSGPARFIFPGRATADS